MNSDKIEKATEIFRLASALPAIERHDFLQKACADDEVLRRQIEQQLKDELPSFSKRPQFPTTRATPLDEIDLLQSVEVRGYHSIKRLQRGGQSIVFSAIQESTGQKVALKILRNGRWYNNNERVRFSREIASLEAINHPNIVRVVDSGQAVDGSLFMAMEFVDGQVLDEWLHEFRQNCVDQDTETDRTALLGIFLKITRAVGAAHKQGITHRDLKPTNVMIDRHDEPRILDFGLARLESSAELTVLTITGQFLGSLPWASPEQAEGKSTMIDARTDVYSLGVILYQILTGAFPYEVSGTMRDVLDNILHVEPTPPSDFFEVKSSKVSENQKRVCWKDLGNSAEDLNAIVCQSLSKRREDRYADANTFGDDIARHLAGEAVHAVRQQKFCESGFLARNKRKIAIPSILATLTMIVGWLVISDWRSAGENASISPRATSASGQSTESYPAGIRPSDFGDESYAQLNRALSSAWQIPEEFTPQSKIDNEAPVLNAGNLSMTHNEVVFPDFGGTGFALEFDIDECEHHNPQNSNISIGIQNARRNQWFSVYCDAAWVAAAGFYRNRPVGEENVLVRTKKLIPHWFARPKTLTLVYQNRAITVFADGRLAFHATGLPKGNFVPRLGAWNSTVTLSNLRIARLPSESALPRPLFDSRDRPAMEHFENRAVFTASILTPEPTDPEVFSVRLCYIDGLFEPFTDFDLKLVESSDALTYLRSYNAEGVTDVGLGMLASKPKLEVLELSHTRVQGKTLDALVGSPNLRRLRLAYCKKLTESIEPITKLSNLRHLDLNGARITSESMSLFTNSNPQMSIFVVPNILIDDSEMDFVGQWEELDLLSLPSRATGECLASFSENHGMTQLIAGNTNFRDDHAEHLTKLLKLKVIKANDTPITNAGLVHIGRVSSLVDLDLQNTVVSDDGLFHIQSLSNLRTLKISGTRVTRDGIANLLKLLPNCKVVEVPVGPDGELGSDGRRTGGLN